MAGAIEQIGETLTARKARERAVREARQPERKAVFLVDGIDATPERLAKEPSDIEKGAIDGGNRVPNARRFKSCRIRALYMNRAITLRAKTAADFFSEICERARLNAEVVRREAELAELADGAAEYATKAETREKLLVEALKSARYFAGNIIEAGPSLPSRQKWSSLYGLASKLSAILTERLDDTTFQQCEEMKNA